MALQRPTFATTTLREGYDIAEVDDLVDRVFDDLAGVTSVLTADEVRDVRFTPVRMRKGYDMGEVDGWLDEVVVALGGRPSPAAPMRESYAAPAPPARSQAAGDRMQAALIIAIVVAAAVWIYVSRF